MSAVLVYLPEILLKKLFREIGWFSYELGLNNAEVDALSESSNWLDGCSYV